MYGGELSWWGVVLIHNVHMKVAYKMCNLMFVCGYFDLRMWIVDVHLTPYINQVPGTFRSYFQYVVCLCQVVSHIPYPRG